MTKDETAFEKLFRACEEAGTVAGLKSVSLETQAMQDGMLFVRSTSTPLAGAAWWRDWAITSEVIDGVEWCSLVSIVAGFIMQRPEAT
jgi:hypothetical protein